MSNDRQLGIAGRMAAAWIHSKLTPLFIIASLGAGAFAVMKLPREEEPQIIVPMVDVFVGMPGATPAEVEQRVTSPMEKLVWEIPGVEYIYSTSQPGGSMLIVRFKVGEDYERSIVNLNQKLQANFDRIPPGATPPIVKPRAIDDVPILAVTVHSAKYDDAALRQIAAQLQDTIAQTPDVSEVKLLGGRRRELRVTLDAARLSARGLSPLQVEGALARANQRIPAGRVVENRREILLEAGRFFHSAADARRIVIASPGGNPVYLEDVATVTDEGAEATQIVQYAGRNRQFESAVTLSVAKRKSTNAIEVASQVLRRIEGMKPTLLPSGVELSITRHYGETAAEKSNELLFHMAIAIFSVTLLIGITLGIRESGIVFVAIPVTLALTLTVFYLYGYTLNRITLFALIFSIGILVDDAIVIVENVVRHARMEVNAGRSLTDITIEAVDEVGNPTILATLTVIAAILPMAFVGGLMGPYMRPIPVGATAAMVFSLLVAFLVTPWATVRLLKTDGHGHSDKEDKLTLLYRQWMDKLIHLSFFRWSFLAAVAVMLLGACGLVYIKFVEVKMLPFDNKSEFQVIINMPEGTALEDTARTARALADAALEQPEVTDIQTYTGTASPYNFNGLVRHYFLRSGPHMADLQINLLNKHDRKTDSHAIARQMRQRLLPIAKQYNARIQVAEVPPGPPVLQTLVAEVYGPDAAGRDRIAREIMRIFENTKGVVDVDWYGEDDQPRRRYRIDENKAAANGVTAEMLARTLELASAGHTAGLLHDSDSREDIPIQLRFDRAARARPETFLSLRVNGVALSEIVTVEEGIADKAIYRKNLMPVTYVTADVAGVVESPVYAILDLGPQIEKINTGGGYAIEQYTAAQPESDRRYAMKWDGEWHITYEVFRDLGIAFAAVLVLIYILVVGWFESFLTPLLIMAAIPFSLVGILPAHGLLSAFFTATSMIGFIAGAGIVVRNSIILVDFIELRRREGMPLDQAVIDAGAVRFRPMMLTAAAVVAGSLVILFDPIFQGLAISLMAGEIASLMLSRVTVPILYFIANRRGDLKQ
ncbi:MAG: efflux RND transporter permease subunit [Bryobacterales bacterium]|nr:efflux RND transporter permease subunit [Bryobacterales bacterium]